MTDAMLYRESLSRMTPGPDWRSQTLAAMDAAAAAPVRRRTPVGPLIAAAAALALVAGGGVGVYRNLNAFRPNEYPGGVLSSAPGYTVGTGELPKITLSAAPDLGMGGFDDTMGMLVVRSPEEQRTQNPTLGNTDSLTELPVYQNRIPTEAEQLGCAETVAAALGTGIASYESNLYGQYRSFTSKCTDGTDIWLSNLNECYVLLPESLPLPGGAETLEEAAPHLWRQLAPLYPMVSPKLEATTSYDFYGRASQWFFWFDDDAGKSLTDRLLDYCFGRVGDVGWHEHTGTGIYTFHLPCWPESEGVLYPIRTAEVGLGLRRRARLLYPALPDLYPAGLQNHLHPGLLGRVARAGAVPAQLPGRRGGGPRGRGGGGPEPGHLRILQRELRLRARRGEGVCGYAGR